MATGRSDGPRRAGIAVIGAGPAGLAAAVAAADVGADVVLLDAEAGPGGQFWRHPAPAGGAAGVGPFAGGAPVDGVPDENDAALGAADVAYLHHGLSTYRRLVARWDRHVSSGRGEYRRRTEVWAAEREGGSVRLHLARGGVGGVAGEIRAAAVVLATGAYDLQVPFRGWDLPGVMTAGGVQALLKGNAVLAGRRVAVAGTGPFLLSVASGLARSGAHVVGIFEAAPARAWGRMAAAGATQLGKFREAGGYGLAFARRRVPVHTGWTVLAAQSHGGPGLASVRVAPVGLEGAVDETRSRTVDVDLLAVGWGFVPRLELAVALGCRTEPGAGGLPVAVADGGQRASVPGVYLAGEVCGVGGAAQALVEGEIAGCMAAAELDGPPAPAQRRTLARRLATPLRRRARMRRFADTLGRSFPVPGTWREVLPPETVVCRCEEVTAADILSAARRYGARDARTVKLLARPGMGWCQGRICGYATEALVAADAGVPAVHRAPGIPVAFPVPLGAVGGPAAFDGLSRTL
jgi:NADPH-dependent 2,4-dienoyl-CoA reductase/sulfur reductase-like enzyme